MHIASKLLRIICILLTLLSVFVCCTAGCTPKNPNGSEPSDPENPPAPEDCHIFLWTLSKAKAELV